MNEETWNVEAARDLLDPHAMVYLLVVMAVLWIARQAFDLAAPYNLKEQLTEKDNKAIAVSFSGYLVGVGAVLLAVLGTDFSDEGDGTVAEFFLEIGVAVAWCLGAIVALLSARLVNDRVIFHRFSNIKELVDDRNVGMGAVEAGSYVGSALILNAAISGESSGFVQALVSTAVYFVVGQALFVAFGGLYSKVVRFDVHAQLEADNAAAGVSVGMSMVAMALLLSGYIHHSSSLVGMLAWFAICVGLLLATRYLVDKLMLPGRLLDEEVAEDKNWGAALIEGCSAVVVAAVVNACFLS